MTLMCTEIHIRHESDLLQNRIVFFADRAITDRDGNFLYRKTKVFQIPYLNAGIGYYGIAYGVEKGRQISLDDKLKDFIQKSGALKTIEEFSRRWFQEATNFVPSAERARSVSGFHIAGFNSDRLPEFWHICNHEGFIGLAYARTFPDYRGPAEQFLAQYGPESLGYDLASKRFGVRDVFTLRNGDIRAHAVMWGALSPIFDVLRQFPDFTIPDDDEGYKQEIQFKMGIINDIYKRFCHTEHVGAGWDTFILRPHT
jgi:hypothetical protein